MVRHLRRVLGVGIVKILLLCLLCFSIGVITGELLGERQPSAPNQVYVARCVTLHTGQLRCAPRVPGRRVRLVSSRHTPCDRPGHRIMTCTAHRKEQR